MSLLPKQVGDFSKHDYWNKFFTKRGSKAFEWYGEYDHISSYIYKYLKEQDDVLIAGCGNSTLGESLYDNNYRNITNIDISSVAIKQMLTKNAKTRPDLKFQKMDVTDMKFENQSFKVVLDKGTLDALMPEEVPTPATLETVTKYFAEIDRVIQPFGRFVCISLLQKHIADVLLDWFPKHDWMWRVVPIKKTGGEGESHLPVFMVVCTKMNGLPKPMFDMDVSEHLNLKDKKNVGFKKFSSAEEVWKELNRIQTMAMLESSAKNDIFDDEVWFELCNQEDTSSTRYTVYLVDRKPKKGNKLEKYACFIVPQGREYEWLFGTKPGRKKLAEQAEKDRLAIVTLHRGEFYDNLEEIKTELDSSILKYKPKGCTSPIEYLTVGGDFIGEREERHKGNSKCSGDYIIEDTVLKEDGAKYRRLYFLESQNVIQSEARLTMMRTKKGMIQVADLIHLTCDHHSYMSIAAHAGCKNKAEPSVAVIGLGGGGLCSFLKAFLPQAKITAVDIDEEMEKVAADWFGLKVDKNLKVVIDDGLKFLQGASKAKDKFDAVLFDVDSKDSTIGMSCPPEQFLENKALADVCKVLTETGLFIVNVVIRDETLRPGILNKLKSKFKAVVAYKLEQDLNEIFVCAKSKIEPENLKSNLSESASAINTFFSMKKKGKDCKVDLEAYVKNLTL